MNYIYNTIEITCTSEFNFKKLLKTIFLTKKKIQLMIQAVPQPTEAHKK